MIGRGGSRNFSEGQMFLPLSLVQKRGGRGRILFKPYAKKL
jgi:hypothetical protein